MNMCQALDVLANEMLGKIKKTGFAPAFVGLVTANGSIAGDVYDSDSPSDSDQFMEAARGRVVQLVASGATAVVVGICVTLFKIGSEKESRSFGLGGPGRGNMFKNKQAALAISGESAQVGVVVMGADRHESYASIYIFAQKEKPITSDGPVERMREAAGTLFSHLPWPIVH